jgi:D-alanyl-D-alanine carboxypeptidase
MKISRINITISIFFIAIHAHVLPGQDYETVVCDSAGVYKGSPLYQGLENNIWTTIPDMLSGDIDSSLSKKLNDVADEILVLTKAPGITIAAGIPGTGIWSTLRGLALTKPPTPLAAKSYFHWASVGKAFTATAVLQLVEENQLSFDNPISTWFPDFPNAKAITIDHLLTHTSGIFSFNADLKFREMDGYKPPYVLIEFAKKHGNSFCPGEYWSYSNTGYVLLAQIVEIIEKQPFHQVLEERIIQVLNLHNTVALAPGQHLPGLARGHTKEGLDESFNESTPFGAGIIASSAKDMVVFWHALLSGKLLMKLTIEKAFGKLYPMFDPGIYYGRGVMLYDVRNDDGEKIVWWLGHSGGTPGIKTIIAYDLNYKIFVAVAINGIGSVEAAANTLIKKIRGIIE